MAVDCFQILVYVFICIEFDPEPAAHFILALWLVIMSSLCVYLKPELSTNGD